MGPKTSTGDFIQEDHAHERKPDRSELGKADRFGCLFLIVLFCLPVSIEAAAPSGELPAETARPSLNGALHVEGTSLADASGNAVQLRGVSTHGLTWFPEYVDPSLFRQISEDWNCNLVRHA